MNGVERIAAERQRQIEAEGWTPEHDDEHDMGQLAAAGAAYAMCAREQAMEIGGEFWSRKPKSWPWDAEWWKPSDDPARNLEKAGALIAAELDRLERKALAERAKAEAPR
jgi:hypothetical protein